MLVERVNHLALFVRTDDITKNKEIGRSVFFLFVF